MVVDERSRHELYRRLEEVLGADAATTLIEHLPPVGWADVATKHDLAQLEERLDGRFTALDNRFDRHDDVVWEALLELEVTFDQALRSQTTTLVSALVGTVLTMAGLAFALARFPT